MAQLGRAVEGLHIESPGAAGTLSAAAQHREEWTRRTRHAFVAAALLEGVPAECAGIWAQVGTHGRPNDDERQWLGVDGSVDRAHQTALTTVAREARGNGPLLARLPSSASPWLMPVSVRAAGINDSGARACLGLVLAAFSSRATALAAYESLHVVSTDLAFGLHFIRVARERHAFLEAAAVLARFEPEDAVRRLALLAQQELRADGFKVYLLRRTRDGVRVQTRLRTDQPQAELKEWFLDEEIGIANWVLLHDDWFLGKVERRGEDGPWLEGYTSNGNSLRRRAMPEAADDPERILWFLPLRFDGHVLGVICPWRNTTDSFDPGSDLPAVEQAGQLLAAACRALVDDEVENAALDTEPRLDQQIDKARTPTEIYTAWAEAAATVGGAAATSLFLKDKDLDGKDSPVYYCAARPLTSIAGLRPCTLRFEQDPDEGELRQRVQAMLAEHASDLRHLVPRVLETLFDDSAPAGVVVLFDHAPSALEDRPTFDDDARRHALRRFVRRRDRRFLRQATEELTRRVLAAFPRDHKHATLDSQRKSLLEAGARLVKEHTGAGNVRLYIRRPDGFERAAQMPSIPLPDRLPEGHGPLTCKALEGKASVHVLDLRDALDPLRHLVQDSRFDRVAEALSWKGVQSWLCEPVVIEDRCVGMFKALTPLGGNLLGEAEERITRMLAREVSAELSELRQAELPTRLNRLTTECARLTGKSLSELSKAVSDAVDKILADFVAPHTRFLATAILAPETLSTLAYSPDVDAAALVEALQWRMVSERDLVLTHALPLREQYPPGTDHVRGVPIEITGTPLRGVLFVFTVGKPTYGDLRVFGDLARALATLAESERRWDEWRREVGLFRHAFFSPAQGLASAAGAVLDEAEQHTLAPDRVNHLRSLIAKETEALRLWRNNQRLYLSRELVLERRRQGLRRFIDQWVERFDQTARRKNARVVLDWRAGADMSLGFDDALLDIAFSNLLDNAVKYAADGTNVIVRIERVGRFVKLAVEDSGRGIPTASRDLIYELGQRATTNRLRRDDGLGLGLALAKGVAEAHDGALTHTCRPPCSGPRTDDRRYTVVFTMQLPER